MIVGIAVIFLMSCMGLYGIIKSNDITLNILTIFVFLQNIVLILLSRNINATLYSIIVVIKELYVILVILWSFRKKRVIDRIELICYVSLIILCGLFFVHQRGGFMSSLASLRQLSFPFIFYIFGKSISISRNGMQKSIYFFVRMSLFSVLFGLVEMILGDRVWALLGIKEYMTFKGTERFIRSGNIVPSAFYSYDFYPIIPRIRRMASVFADPVILGQILGMAFILAAFFKDLTSVKNKRLMYCILLGLGLILSIAKGGIIIAGISALMLIRELWRKKIFSGLCIIIAAMLAVRYIVFGLANSLSISKHLDGLLGGIDILRRNLFGLGIGGYGNIGNNYSIENVIEGSESFIGAALGQIGIFVIVYMWFYYAFLKKLKMAATYDSLSKILFWLNMSLLGTSLVNNTAMSFTNCYIFYILPAINLKIIQVPVYVNGERTTNRQTNWAVNHQIDYSE